MAQPFDPQPAAQSWTKWADQIGQKSRAQEATITLLCTPHTGTSMHTQGAESRVGAELQPLKFNVRLMWEPACFYPPKSSTSVMDPVTAIGLASGIISFVTFSIKLVSGAIKIHDAADGQLQENLSRELVIQEMQRLSGRLLAPDNATLMGEEKGLCVLATECQSISNDLIALLERIKPKDPSSKAQSLWSALKNAIHDKEKVELEGRLDRCRSQLELHIMLLTR